MHCLGRRLMVAFRSFVRSFVRSFLRFPKNVWAILNELNLFAQIPIIRILDFNRV